MAQSQQATSKRRVMGRIDIGPSDSPSAGTTPTARPRLARTVQVSSSPAVSTPTPSSSRTPTTSGRAKVDMSAFANPSSSVSTPTMSPLLTRNGSHSSRIRTVVASPSIPSSSPASSRPTTAVGGAHRASAGCIISSPESRGDDQSFISLRSHRARASNRSVDLGSHVSLPTSPNLSGYQDVGSIYGAAGAPVRASLPRAQTSSNVRTSSGATINSTPGAPSPIIRSQARAFGFPPPNDRSVARSRTPSPSLLEPSKLADRAGSTLVPAYESPGSPRDTLVSTPAGTSPKFLEAPFADTVAPPLKRRSSLASAASITVQKPAHVTSATGDVRPGFSATIGRSHARSNSSIQRATIPKAIATPSYSGPGAGSGPTSPRTSATPSAPPALLNRASFASSVASSNEPNSALLSPTSESSGVSAAVLAEAEGARSNRKLLDLEITNKSLMAINAALEATKLKQAREIRDLKRRLREGRGISMGPAEIAASLGLSDDEDGDYFEDADDDGLIGEEDAELEAAHQRCKTLIDSMVHRARRAILSKYTHEDTGLGGKVLHPVELEQMRIEAELEQQRETDQNDENGEHEADATIESQDNGDRSAASRADMPQVQGHDTSMDEELNTSEETDAREGSRDPSDTSLTGSSSLTTPEIELDTSFVSEEGSDSTDSDQGEREGEKGEGPGRMTRTIALESFPLRRGPVDGDVSID